MSSPTTTTTSTTPKPKPQRMDRLFALVDMGATLTPMQRVQRGLDLQIRLKEHYNLTSSEYQLVSDLTVVSAAPEGASTVYALTLTPFYCSARGVLSGSGAALICDITTLASMVTIYALSPETWCIDASPDELPDLQPESARLMNFAGASRRLDVTYVRPAFLGERVSVECRVVAVSGAKALVRADVRNARGVVCASCTHDAESMAKAIRAMM